MALACAIASIALAIAADEFKAGITTTDQLVRALFVRLKLLLIAIDKESQLSVRQPYNGFLVILPRVAEGKSS